MPLFRSLARSGEPVDQIRFAKERGLAGVSDNYLMLREPAEQEALGAHVRNLGLEFGSFVHDPLNWNRPTWTVSDTTARTALLDAVEASLAAAGRSGSRAIVCVTGRDPQRSHTAQLEAMAANLARAGDRAAVASVTLCIEATHPDFAPGALVERLDDALELVRKVDHPNVRLDLDVGHVALHGEDVVAAIRRCQGWIGMVQIADVPGRVEPGAGTLDWPAIFAALENAGHDGLLELELEPAEPGAAGEQALLDRLDQLTFGQAGSRA